MQNECELQVSTPEAMGLDPDKLNALIHWLDELEGSNIHSLLIARSGLLAFEHYRTGTDEHWRKPLGEVAHGAHVLHDLRSVTKVVTGLLVGKALQDNLIADLDQPVFSYFPDYGDLCTDGKDGIRLHHLLTMSAGLEWNENVSAADPNHGELRLWQSSDRMRTALEPRLVTEPGTVWNYSGGCTELLGEVLKRVSGKPLDEFAQSALFDPLAISDVEWARHSDGSPSASGGLRMRSRDLAKIGMTVADGGKWSGQQVLPEAWIETSLTAHIGAHDRLFYYGYHWWLGRSLVSGRSVSWAAGIGLGGQRLFVIPELNMALAITAGHYADAMQAWLPLTILNRFILAAVD